MPTMDKEKSEQAQLCQICQISDTAIHRQKEGDAVKLTDRTTKNSLGGLLVTLLILAFTCEAAAQAEWVELNPTGGPPIARSHHAAIYDPSTNRMIA